jgi:hypothetical protein
MQSSLRFVWTFGFGFIQANQNDMPILPICQTNLSQCTWPRSPSRETQRWIVRPFGILLTRHCAHFETRICSTR